MSEDVVTINLEFDTLKSCKEVHSIFYNLRAAERNEVEKITDNELLQQIGDISNKAKQLLLTPLQGTEEEKVWLLEEITPSNKQMFEFQWSFLSMEGAWVESHKLIHLLGPDDFPSKNRKKMSISWMWNRSYKKTRSRSHFSTVQGVS